MKSRLKRTNPATKLAFFAVAAIFYVLFASIPNWQIGGGDGKYLVKGGGHQVALADGPVAGNSPAPGPMGPACAGQVTLASGIGQQQAPCMVAFKACGAFYSTTGTPAVGALSCAPTATTTVISAATVTVTAVIINQSSPAGAPTINWVGGPF